jgi:hypothetical protein
MGKPEYLNAGEVDQLEVASSMMKRLQALEYQDRSISFDIALPPHSVAAITIEVKLQPKPCKSLRVRNNTLALDLKHIVVVVGYNKRQTNEYPANIATIE